MIKEATHEGLLLVNKSDISCCKAAKEVLKNPKYSHLAYNTLRIRITNAKRYGSTKAPEETKVKSAPDPKPFVLSAWNYDTGRMMDIDEYCQLYNLPRDQVRSYKLITHTGTPYYNTLFKDALEHTMDGITDERIQELVQRFITPVDYEYVCRPHTKEEWFDRAIYTDCHNGMETNRDGIAMYATTWDMPEQLRRIHKMAEMIIHHQTGEVLYLDELGDFQDGWDALTVRGGHQLPQNKSNGQAFDDGVVLKMTLIDLLAKNYRKIYCNNICNDNHSGDFGYVTNSTFKMIAEMKYSHVEVTNHRQFMNHYIVGKHGFVISHGKDDKTLKFGFKPKLDPVQIEKIDGYLKSVKLYQNAEFIEFSKGDSHQMLLDYCTSDDFHYFNYPALSPSSEWVQNNFKKGRSGFVVQNIRYDAPDKYIKPYFF